MFPSVLTARRSAPLQGRWVGCGHRTPLTFSPQRGPQPPPSLGLLSRTLGGRHRRSPGPRCCWEKLPLSLGYRLKPGEMSLSLHLCLQVIGPCEHAQWAHLPGGGARTLESPGRRAQVPRQPHRAPCPHWPHIPPHQSLGWSPGSLSALYPMRGSESGATAGDSWILVRPTTVQPTSHC